MYKYQGMRLLTPGFLQSLPTFPKLVNNDRSK